MEMQLNCSFEYITIWLENFDLTMWKCESNVVQICELIFCDSER